MENNDSAAPTFFAAKCPSCGGELRVPENRKKVICMYCGNQVFVTNGDLSGVSDFDFSYYNDLLEKAWKANNYEETYKYATLIIEKSEDKSILAPIWVYRGWAAGYLSTPSRPRITEMKEYIKNGVALNAASLNLNVVAETMAYILYFINYDIFNFWVQEILAKVENRPPQTVYVQSKSISENIGAGLGAGIAQGMIANSEAKRMAKNYGPKYQDNYAKLFVNCAKYAWSLSTTKGVAKNVFLYVCDVIEAPCIDAETKKNVVELLSDEISEIKTKFPDMTLPEIKKDGCSPCFIATAVMGDQDHPYVNILRSFRDMVLNKSLIGKLFITIYYLISPPFARLISKYDCIRLILLKVLIRPLVYIIVNINRRYASKEMK